MISGTLSGPSTKGRVLCGVHVPTRHSKGPAAHDAVGRFLQTATSSTGMPYFARKYANDHVRKLGGSRAGICGAPGGFTHSRLGGTFRGYLATNWVRIAWTS